MSITLNNFSMISSAGSSLSYKNIHDDQHRSTDALISELLIFMLGHSLFGWGGALLQLTIIFCTVGRMWKCCAYNLDFEGPGVVGSCSSIKVRQL